MSELTRRQVLLAGGAIVGGLVLGGCGRNKQPRNTSPHPVDRGEQVVLDQLERFGNKRVAEFVMAKSGLVVSVFSDSEQLRLNAEAFEPTFMGILDAGSSTYAETKPDLAQAFGIIKGRIFEQKALAGKSLRLFIASNPATCMSPEGLKPTTQDIAGSDPACTNYSQAVGFTQSGATDLISGERFATPILTLIAPSIYNGQMRVVRNDQEVYALDPDQAVHAILAHESFHIVNRLQGLKSTPDEESIAQSIEATFVRTNLLVENPPVPSPVNY